MIPRFLANGFFSFSLSASLKSVSKENFFYQIRSIWTNFRLKCIRQQYVAVKLRPLTVRDVQLIAKAAKGDEVLTSVLMMQKAAVEPKLKQDDIAKMHSGLVGFLIDQINHISGLSTTEDEMKEIAESPIVQAFFVLAKEFNWTPQQVKEMTLGQILGYLEMLNQAKRSS